MKLLEQEWEKLNPQLPEQWGKEERANAKIIFYAGAQALRAVMLSIVTAPGFTEEQRPAMQDAITNEIRDFMAGEWLRHSDLGGPIQ